MNEADFSTFNASDQEFIEPMPMTQFALANDGGHFYLTLSRVRFSISSPFDPSQMALQVVPVGSYIISPELFKDFLKVAGQAMETYEKVFGEVPVIKAVSE